MEKGNYCTKHKVYHKNKLQLAGCPDKAVTFTKAEWKESYKVSQKICELRQNVIDKAVAWEAGRPPSPAHDLSAAVKRYVKFKQGHFGEKT